MEINIGEKSGTEFYSQKVHSDQLKSVDYKFKIKKLKN